MRFVSTTKVEEWNLNGSEDQTAFVKEFTTDVVWLSAVGDRTIFQTFPAVLRVE